MTATINATPRRGALPPFEELPAPLFHNVMRFHLTSDRPKNTHDRTDAVGELTKIARVSKAVRATAKEMQAMLILGQMGVSPRSTKRSQVLNLRRRVILRRAFLRDLVLNVEPDRDDVPRSDHYTWCMRMSTQVAVLVSHAPELQLLDLRKFLGAPDEIVRAAARCCPQLQSLLLPSAEMYEGIQRADGRPSLDLQSLMDALLAGLPQWHVSNGGLRQLRLPNRHEVNRLSNSTQFLQAVATYCPRMELLDGYGLLQADKEGWSLTKPERVGHCGDEWIVTRSAWEQFCKSFVHLRAFNWAVAPWTTSFFEIFAKYPKPQLTALTLHTPMVWNWNEFLSDIGSREAQVIKTTGFGATATRAVAVLEACPALKKLSIVLNSHVDGDDYGIIGSMLQLTGDEVPLSHPPLQLTNVMNQELYGASFCEALARLCPLLEEFSLKEEHEELATIMERVTPIAAFNDKALQSLAKLPKLSRLDVKATTVTGRGLFNFVNSPGNNAVGQRFYQLALGQHQRGRHAWAFYVETYYFMESLLEHRGSLHLESQPICMRITNGNWGEMEPGMDREHLRVLKLTVNMARAKFPSLQFRVEVDGLTETSFTTIYAFGFFTATATPPKKMYWTESDIIVDDVFVIHSQLKECQDDVANEYKEFMQEREQYMYEAEMGITRDYGLGEDMDY